MDRNLDGVYFRMKRGEHYENVCFSDLTEEERNFVLIDRKAEWLASLCCHLADSLKIIGEEFDIMGADNG